jgi:hypothetical protein
MNIILGISTVFVGTIIQCAFIAALQISFRNWRHELSEVAGNFLLMTLLLSGVTTFLFLGMMVQVSLWALLFIAVGEVDDIWVSMYFSMVNFTSLGYGDITLSPNRAILGPMEAANGILMLGLCTSALFSLLRQLTPVLGGSDLEER